MWRSRYGVLMVFLLVGTIHGKSVRESGDSAASSPAGAPESDKKVSASISHILRSLSFPPSEGESEKTSPVQIITKHGILEAKPGTSRTGSRKLFWGETSGLDSQPGVPNPVVVSSQTIRISNPNGTSGKRGRSLTTSVDADGVKTIEGVRVPDDEHDKFHTYRNARVIKNFLVENDRPANPHKKRQIVIQDASQYLAAAAGNNGQTATIIDASSFAQPQGQSYYIAQPQAQQVMYTATASPIQAQQVYQYTATPSSYAALSSGASVFAQPQQQQQQGQMYVLQADGKTYLPYNPSTASTVQVQQVQQVQEQVQQQQQQSQAYTISQAPEQRRPEQQQQSAQTQFASRSGEISEAEDRRENQGKLRQQYEYQQRILSLHRNKDTNQIEIRPHSGQEGQQVSEAPPQFQHRLASPSPTEFQQIARVAATALPTGASIRQQLQEQVFAQTARVHIEDPGQRTQVHHVQYQPQNFIQEHAFSTAAPPHSHAMPVNPNQFIIKPHSYLAGGGQIFQVPVPIPIDQANSREEQQHQPRSEEREEEEKQEKKSGGLRQTLTNRIMETLHLNVNRRTAERIETSAVVPVLTSAGIIMGLGAIAAGWYLSQSNREVGILKRTGKPAASTGTKDNAIINHLRTKRGLGPGGEVDQASFFQSIIQHGIEKQQQQFEPEPTQAYKEPAYKPYSAITQSKIAAAVKEDRDRISAAEKKGKGNRLSKLKNFANVAIPSVVLGGSVLFIGGLIFYWYISGKNREIAFLEPSAYSRRKRSLAFANSPVMSSLNVAENWLPTTLTSTHTNPFETRVSGRREYKTSRVVGLDTDVTSKSTQVESDLGYLTVALCLAAFAFGSLTVLGLAWYFTDNSRDVHWEEPYDFGHFPTMHKHYLHKRAVNWAADASSNDVLPDDSLPENTSFFQQLLGNLEFSQNSLLTKLQEKDYSKWQETPCAMRIFCDVMSTQADDTIRLMEKRITKYLYMLPESMSESLSRTLGGVMMAIKRGDCSAYTCSNNWMSSILSSSPLPR